MPDHSLPPEALQRFLAGTAGRSERKEIARHLLQGCPVCQGFFRQILGPRSLTVPMIGPSYDEAFESAHQIISQGLDQLDEPHHFLIELLSHPFPRQAVLIRHQRRYWSIPFCEHLVKESYAVRFSDPGAMQQLSYLAILVAARLEGAGDEQEISDCQASAWMAFGNALRAVGDLNRADQALVRAGKYLDLGHGAPEMRADLLGKTASLRCNQRRFDDALALSQEDIDLRRDLYSPEDVAYSLTKHALSLGEGGRPSDAVAFLREAETTAKRAAKCSQLSLIIRHNLIHFELSDGDPELAHQDFMDAESLYRENKDPLLQFKATWLKGLIFDALGQHQNALDHLFEARQHLLEHRNMLDVAWVGLDCATVLTKLGRKQEVRRLAGAAMREFGARGIKRDYLAALILLRQAS